MKTIPVRQTDKLALVDDEDYDRIIQFNWRAVSHSRTVLRNYQIGFKTRSVSMASEVMGQRKQLYDHIDRDPFNNQKSNLRPATVQQNCFNRSKEANTTSKFKGVSWKKRIHKWQAQIKLNQKNMYLGVFSEPEEAARAYDKKAKELFGEFAVLNFPQDLISRHSEARQIREKYVAEYSKLEGEIGEDNNVPAMAEEGEDE